MTPRSARARAEATENVAIVRRKAESDSALRRPRTRFCSSTASRMIALSSSMTAFPRPVMTTGSAASRPPSLRSLDTLLEHGELLRDLAADARDPAALGGIIGGQAFEPVDIVIDDRDRPTVRLQIALAAREEEAALARLGVPQVGEDGIQADEDVVGMGDRVPVAEERPQVGVGDDRVEEEDGDGERCSRSRVASGPAVASRSSFPRRYMSAYQGQVGWDATGRPDGRRTPRRPGSPDERSSLPRRPGDRLGGAPRLACNARRVHPKYKRLSQLIDIQL